jgi:hypothetical protein
MATAPRPEPAAVAHSAPDWLGDSELDALLATPEAAAALSALHARPELPRAAREALGDASEEWAEWLRSPAGEALMPLRLRALCRAGGQLWPRLCMHLADAHGAQPLRAGVSNAAVAAAVAGEGDSAGRLWLGLLYGADESLVRPLLNVKTFPAPAAGEELPPPPAYRPWWALVVVGAVFLLLYTRRRGR